MLEIIIMLKILIICFFSFWTVLTLINQFDYDWVKNIVRYDIFRLIPRWTFFAPNPGTNDFHFLYRGMDDHKRTSEFNELIDESSRSLLSFLWNPKKRVKKVLVDLAISTSQIVAKKMINESNIKISFNYIAYLNFCQKSKLDTSMKFVQFVVLISKGFLSQEDPKMLLCSEFHKID